MNPAPFDQQTYQVRLEWGVEGLARLAPADVIVVVDVLRFSTTVVDAVTAGGPFALDERGSAVSINGAAVAAAAAADGRSRPARLPPQRVGGRRGRPHRARAPRRPHERGGDRRGRADGTPPGCRPAIRAGGSARRRRHRRCARRPRHRPHVAGRGRGRRGVPRASPRDPTSADRKRLRSRARPLEDAPTRSSTPPRSTHPPRSRCSSAARSSPTRLRSSPLSDSATGPPATSACVLGRQPQGAGDLPSRPGEDEALVEAASALGTRCRSRRLSVAVGDMSGGTNAHPRGEFRRGLAVVGRATDIAEVAGDRPSTSGRGPPSRPASAWATSCSSV